MEAKRIAAEYAAMTVEDGMVVGLGTGSTAYWAIAKLADRVRGGLRIKAVATSKESEEQARTTGIPIISFAELDGRKIDVTIDGADEVDRHMDLIKGGGGALLREKIVAASSNRLVIVVDSGKIVETLGKFQLPVEIVPFGMELTLQMIGGLGGVPKLRLRGGELFRTDNGNYIADCDFGSITEPAELTGLLNTIPGVVENGLFAGMADTIIIGSEDGKIEERNRG